MARSNKIVSEKMIKLRQESWADSIIGIGKAYRSEEDYTKLARDFVSSFYAYEEPGIRVLFKPTLAKSSVFRITKEGALAYFIGKDKQYPEDRGFAIQPWQSIAFHNACFQNIGNISMVGGDCIFTNTSGSIVAANYTMAYIMGSDHTLKMVVHHSSLSHENPIQSS